MVSPSFGRALLETSTAISWKSEQALEQRFPITNQRPGSLRSSQTMILGLKLEEAAKSAVAEIRVLPGAGEKLPFEDASFDVVTASLVLCSVTLPSKTWKSSNGCSALEDRSA